MHKREREGKIIGVMSKKKKSIKGRVITYFNVPK
jgi:hypothetical protein